MESFSTYGRTRSPESGFGHEVYSCAEEILEVNLEFHVFGESWCLFEFHQQIDITCGGGFIPSYRTEQTQRFHTQSCQLFPVTVQDRTNFGASHRSPSFQLYTLLAARYTVIPEHTRGEWQVTSSHQVQSGSPNLIARRCLIYRFHVCQQKFCEYEGRISSNTAASAYSVLELSGRE